MNSTQSWPLIFVLLVGALAMRKAILNSVLLAMSIAYTGCSSGADGEGSGGGSGSTAPLRFDADTSLPAAGGAAAVVEFAAQFENTMSSIIAALGNAPAAASSGVTLGIKRPSPMRPLLRAMPATATSKRRAVEHRAVVSCPVHGPGDPRTLW